MYVQSEKNGRRVDRGRQAMAPTLDDDIETTLADTLTNIGHAMASDGYKLDWIESRLRDALKRAMGHLEAEWNGEE